MKKLSENVFNRLNRYMNKESRPLERDIFNYYFNDGDADNVLNSLKQFQNDDGGFGNGIEPDFKLIESSPMATSIGLKYLSIIDDSEEAEEMIFRAVEYLEKTFDSKRNRWYSVSKKVNEYPHAYWWEYKEDINMTVIDYYWGNPTAELIGYLYKYKKHLKNIDIESLIKYAIDKLNSHTEFKSEHEIYCYIRLYNALDEDFSNQLVDKLELAIKQLINTNESEWENYVPTPLRFIEFDSKNYFGIDSEFLNKELDYLIDKLNEDGKISPTWEWDRYLNEWEKAKKEWTGIRTLEALLILLKFDRIELGEVIRHY
ncbi:hypothetical protein [Senegalia massiliensis]|uniref:Uncharacterized protein n=1 Tax=Senegalia massiliensis TaxID=1720316 RepID=A0A845QU97_9CLOT|nr:hypothetical protein [Senegalia massiliensis]NBI05590.1 hypothetical protein [Senegalia massiliensis]